VKPVIAAPLATLIVRLLAALSAPVRMAAAELADTVTPVATLTIIAVLSVAELYPAAVAWVRIL
jgi:hypothetical protein